jgi:hypothetical protein
MEVGALGLRRQIGTGVELERRNGAWCNVWRARSSQGTGVRLDARVCDIAGTPSCRLLIDGGEPTESGGHQLSLGGTIGHGILEARASAKVQPPYLVVFLHLIIYTAKDPYPAIPDPACVIVSRNKLPRARPRPCFQIQETYVVQNAVMPGLTSTDV